MFFELWSVVGPRETLGTRRKASAVVTPRLDFRLRQRLRRDKMARQAGHRAIGQFGEVVEIVRIASGACSYRTLRRWHCLLLTANCLLPAVVKWGPPQPCHCLPSAIRYPGRWGLFCVRFTTNILCQS